MSTALRTTFAAVLFDCDGVLIDSEHIARRSMQNSLASLGLGWTEGEVAARFTGLSWPQCVAILEHEMQLSLPAHFADDNREFFDHLLATELVPMVGIKQVLEALTVPYAVVTNSMSAELNNKLQVSGLAPFFPPERRFDAETMGVSKPDPGIYQQAAARMGVDVRECLVLEDSRTGAQSAYAAGANLWLYQPQFTAEQCAAFNVQQVLQHWAEMPTISPLKTIPG